MGDSGLDLLAESQYGLITHEQAVGRLPRDQLRSWVRRRLLVPVRPGVYRFQGVPESWEQQLLAVCLATDAVASHRAAARLWSLEGVAALRLEVTTPSGRPVRLPGVRAHRSNRLGPEFLTVHRGIPVTTPARTLVDLSAVAPAPTVEKAVDGALRDGLVTVASLRTCFDAVAGRGRRRVAHFRPVLDARQPGYSPGDSALEVRVQRWLTAAGLPPPALQFRVRIGDRRYRLDLAYPDLRIAVELDGWAAHSTRRAFDHDRARGNDLELEGWTLLRFTSSSSRTDVVRTVQAARAAASASRTLRDAIPL
jgi:very-short-patch-repair endonuclease